MTRRTKTPAERAQESFDRVCRQLGKARARRDTARTELEQAQAEVDRLTARRDFLASDPDLPPAQQVDNYQDPASS